jgi:predicted MFS family arabinose efflux permease
MSLACAAAPSLGLLLVARALQGAAAAMMIPASLAVVLSDTPPEKARRGDRRVERGRRDGRGRGPALGGVLVDTFGWRSVFVINVPVGLAILAGARAVPAARPGGRAAARPSPARCCSAPASAQRRPASPRVPTGAGTTR